MKPLPLKKPPKDQRELLVLFKLIELYLETGKPVGSNTLRDEGFSYLSSATIRNYLAKLEKLDYLYQHHASGGRTPTDLAYIKYASYFFDQPIVDDFIQKRLSKALKQETKQVASYLGEAAEVLSELTNCAVFLSSPRFDQDFVSDVQLIRLDINKVLCVLISNFGLIQTETLYIADEVKDLDSVQNYFLWRLSRKSQKPQNMDKLTAKWAQRIYNEMMVRHVAEYTNFFKEDIYRTGLSKLLTYPEFADAKNLAKGLSLFENPLLLQKIAGKCLQNNKLNYWIGKQLEEISASNSNCSVIAIPYYIQKTPVGVVAILAPTRVSYRKLFGTLRLFSQYLSDTLSRSVSQFKISFRRPSENSKVVDHSNQILLEDRSK